ncbi:FtsK/SpoIIIE domain-containing protein [Kitasatospora sp. HPMI-4]|uniref:FtsK/SpoIIIE domain-containing protein n=1 Tax=Kitasatospora sp. HPMI-4 TaxID=3448443 RepID=UPI003F1B1F57
MTEQPSGPAVDLRKETQTMATVTYLPGANPDSVYAAPEPQPVADAAPAEPAPVLGGSERSADGAATVLEGVVIPSVPELREDPDGDRPLIPGWIRTKAGRRSYREYSTRQVRRAVRRWVRRQRTERGHVAQFRRGLRLAHEFVVGVEGVHVQATGHQAHIAAKEARQAARVARFTMLPGKKASVQAHADRALTVAQAAVAAHRRAKQVRSRARNLRAAVVYGPPAAALATGYLTVGDAGATAAGLLTFAAGAFAGRRPQTVTEWDDEYRYLGDGERMTDTMLNKVFQAAKVIGSDESLHMVRPAMRDVESWCAMFDLPPGVTAKKAMRAVDEIAAAFGVETAQVAIDKAGRSGRLELNVFDRLPFTGKPDPGALLALDGPVNFWGRIEIGPTVRNDRYSISVVERSGLIGGEPGAGKSASGNTILLAAALDPRVILWLADGKGGGDLEPFEPLCERYEGDADPAAFDAMLDEAIADMKARYALLKKLGKRKVTEELANEHKLLRQKLLWVDELMLYTTDEDYGKKITKKLRNLVSRGRAAGIITFCATQKPGSDVVDTSLRDLLSIRWALRCTTPEASDTILGKGAAAAGYSAKVIEMEMRGAGYLWAEGSNPVLVRADYYDDDQVAALLKRAFVYREAAGTLPKGEPTLAELLRAKGEDDKDAQLLAALVDVVDAYLARDEKTDWIAGADLVEALQAAGLEINADRLGNVVKREGGADRYKRTIKVTTAEGEKSSRVSGYPVELIVQTAQKYVLGA